MKPTKAELIERHEHLLYLDEQGPADCGVVPLTEHEKKHHLDMRNYEKKTPCGTLFCLSGFASRQQWFKENGFHWTRVDEDDFFGRHAYVDIFSPYLSSDWPEAMQRVRDRLERIKAMPEEQA